MMMMMIVCIIGVIYGGMRAWGTGAITFWTEGYRTPTFQDEKVKNLLSPEAICGDLITIKLFLAGAQPGPR